MKILVNIIRVFVGILFIISGFVKLVDPTGFSYKLEEYFGPSVFNIPILSEIALGLSVVFIILEVILGVLLLLGVVRNLTLIALLLLIIGFSFLTFYSAYFDKVEDCGCFGDAITLSPWATFSKDLVLLVLVLILWFNRKYIKPIFPFQINKFIVILSTIASIAITYWGISHLPLIDFRPYAIGNNLKEEMADGVDPKIEMNYTLVNEDTKERKTINDSVYTASGIWEDPKWVIDTTATKEVVLTQGRLPSVNNFDIMEDGENITENILNLDKVVLITVPFGEGLDTETRAKIINTADSIEKTNTPIYILTNLPDQLAPKKSYMVDPITLKTINRSNGGVLVIKKGIVTDKYHYNDIPSVEKIIK